MKEQRKYRCKCEYLQSLALKHFGFWGNIAISIPDFGTYTAIYIYKIIKVLFNVFALENAQSHIYIYI